MRSLIGLVCLVIIIPSFAHAGDESRRFLNRDWVHYDRGVKKKNRNFQSADICQEKPCIVSQRGAIKFSKPIQKNYNIELGTVHEDKYSIVSLFQAASNLDDKFGERLFNKRQNRAIFNLERAIELGETDTVHVYGILLHYPIDEGDLFVVTLTHYKNPAQSYQYFFRYHQEGPIWDVDVGLLAPIRYFRPNPNNVIRGATVTVGLSLSVGWYMDPEEEHKFSEKLLHSFKLNMVTGLLSRREIAFRGNDQIVDMYFDGFVGGGFTFLDFIIGGVGVNLGRSPHAMFPFVGFEVKHLYEFIKSLKKSTKHRWEDYLKEENKL